VSSAEALREKIELAVFADELFGENCYLVRRKDTTETLLIDPGLQYRQVLEHVEREGLTVKQILITHAHVDHIAGVPAIATASSAPISMHADDEALLDWENFGRYPFLPPDFAPFVIGNRLEDGQVLKFNDLEVRVLHTPGHTEGSVCFVFGLDCFSGDTLFQRGIGRTDLPGGNTQKIVFSIRNVLYALPPKTLVYPGHGPRTTIEEEMLLNPFVPR
jgi:glyoxylase-like metal-dependent hydrolase (beta-lactamase superfamily II)